MSSISSNDKKEELISEFSKLAIENSKIIIWDLNNALNVKLNSTMRKLKRVKASGQSAAV